MVEVRVRQPVAPDDVENFRVLVEDVERADGNPLVGDAVFRDLQSPSSDTALLLAYDGKRVIGGLHLAAPDNAAPPRHTIAVVVEPGWRATGVARALVETAVELAQARDGHRMELWAFGATDDTDRFATAMGFQFERELWQMRVPLPLTDGPRWPPGIEIRTFVPGQDEPAWLEVNNRAFRDDPDQGNWDERTLARREAEPWFDPNGFLLAVDTSTGGGGIAGFCWTKVHPPALPHEPQSLGEIYVIGVNPDRQGIGLGRALVGTGLTSLHDRGIRTGMLFVDARNGAAVGLYQVMGFEVTRVDRAYVRDTATLSTRMKP